MPGITPKNPLHLAIVGGGIGGLVLAISLSRHGIPFHIYEAASQFSEIGAGVGLGPNAQRAMHLIDPRIKEAYDRHAALNFDEEHRAHYFQFRLGMDGLPNTNTEGFKAGHLISQPGGRNKGMSMIHRATFLDELVALLPEGCASFGKRLEHLEQSGSRTTLFFADGTTVETLAVIGCDGVKSKVRESIFGEQTRARFTGKYAYRGLIPMGKAVKLVGQDRARNSQAYLGYDGHVLTMPVDGGNTMNIVAFRTAASSVWKDHRWVIPMQQEDMRNDFAEWGPDVTKLLGAMENTDLWGIFDHPRLQQMHSGNVALLGDAAHATSPHQGSGAGMAIEDALILGHMLGLTKDYKDLQKAFSAYNSVRLERTMRIIETSRECGDVYEFLHKDTRDDLCSIDQNLCFRYNWIWDVDLSTQIADAESIYSSICI